MSDLEELKKILDDHEETYECAAHSEGLFCCLDSEHPLGIAVRKALGYV